MIPEDLYFRLTLSDRVKDSLRSASARAATAGRLIEVRDAIELMKNWLKADPETLGEPYRIYKSEVITEYLGFVGLLIVRYNIHHASKQVFVLYPVRVARWAGF
jgi:hypothetical protein